jgi:hypothetical protein
MPKIENWSNLPEGIRQHLIDRMRDRAISIADLNALYGADTPVTFTYSGGQVQVTVPKLVAYVAVVSN